MGKWPEATPQKAAGSHSQQDGQLLQNSLCQPSSKWEPLSNWGRLTHCIPVDSSTVIYWLSPFVILGVSGLFCRFYSIFDGKSCLRFLTL